MKTKMMIGALAVSALMLMAACGSSNSSIEDRRKADTVGKFGWIFEGWACQPDAVAGKGVPPSKYCDWPENEDKPRDYLYIKVAAAPSRAAVRENNIAMKLSTCRQASKDQVDADGLAKVLGSILSKTSGVVDGRSTGFAIMSKVKGRISGTGIYDCCSIDNKTGACADPTKGEPEKWESCMCVGYIKYPGGQAAFESKATELAKEHEAN